MIKTQPKNIYDVRSSNYNKDNKETILERSERINAQKINIYLKKGDTPTIMIPTVTNYEWFTKLSLIYNVSKKLTFKEN